MIVEHVYVYMKIIYLSKQKPHEVRHIYIYVIYKDNDACNREACTCRYEGNVICNMM